MALTGKQKRFLRAMGHPLPVVVQIGKGGVSDAIATEISAQLETHELIKIRVNGDEKAKVVAESMAADVRAEVAQVLGKTALLYRAREKDPDIVLPTSKTAS